jgi:RimJ/RimL family protein N-acetyltransferase
MPDITLVPPARLEADGLVLRAWTPDDAPLLQRTFDASEAHLRAWTPRVIDGKEPGLTLVERLARHAEAFAAGTEWLWGIFTPDEGTVLGGCGLYPRIGPGAVEIGYWLAQSATRRGIATAATRMLADVAFGAPDVARVEIRAEPRNAASLAVPQRLGFRHVATEPEPGGVLLMHWAMDRETWLVKSPPVHSSDGARD